VPSETSNHERNDREAIGEAGGRKPEHCAQPTGSLAIGSESCNRLFITFVGLEDGVEPGTLKQFGHSLIRADQFDFTLPLPGGRQRRNQGTQASAIHVVDSAEVDDDMLGAQEDVPDSFAESGGLVAEDKAPGAVQNDHIFRNVSLHF
jgi:hypothetical protein